MNGYRPFKQGERMVNICLAHLFKIYVELKEIEVWHFHNGPVKFLVNILSIVVFTN